MEIKRNFFKRNKNTRYSLLYAFVAFIIMFLIIIQSFLVDIVLSAVTAAFMYPVFKWIQKIIKNRTLASLLCCLIVLTIILIPLSLIFEAVIKQGSDFYSSLNPFLQEMSLKNPAKVAEVLRKTGIGKLFASVGVSLDFKTLFGNTLKLFNSVLITSLHRISQSTITMTFDFISILFFIFYFFKDGEKLLFKIRNFLPFNNTYKSILIEKLDNTSNIIIKGIFLIALVQSVSGTMVLFLFNVKAWLLWGVIMFVLAAVPVLSIGIILIPAGLIRMLSGSLWQGIVIISLSLLIIAVTEGMLRPRLVGKFIGIHDAVVFISMIGGLVTLGPSGFIIGPLIAAVLSALLDIVEMENNKTS